MPYDAIRLPYDAEWLPYEVVDQGRFIAPIGGASLHRLLALHASISGASCVDDDASRRVWWRFVAPIGGASRVDC